METKRTLPLFKGIPEPRGVPVRHTKRYFQVLDPGKTVATVSGVGYGAHERSSVFRSGVEAIKEAVPLAEYAGEITELKRSGGALVRRCPIPDHEDITPPFTVWPPNAAGHGSWWCFGCSRGSDVIDLYYNLHGCSEMWEALVGLSLERGVDLLGRSKAWYRATQRKAEYRDAAYRVLGSILKRRLFRVMVLPYIDAIQDPEEHDRQLRRAWAEWDEALFWPALAERMLNS